MTMRPTMTRSLRVLACLGALALLAGCSLLSGKPSNPSTIYAPDPRVPADPAWPTVAWQLSVAPPTGARMIDSLRIAVRPTPNELQVYKGVSWAKRPGDMLEDALLRTLEDSGRIGSVVRQGSGISADYKLVLDLRRFESDYAAGAATPAATVEVAAKLLHVPSQQVAAARTFQQAQPATSTAVADVVTAFEQALGTVAHDLAGWTLASGEQYQRSQPRR